MLKNQGLQDQILGEAKRERTQVTMFLVNGFQLRGTVDGYDSFIVVLNSDGKQQMIYKHAISTITPVRAFELPEEAESA